MSPLESNLKTSFSLWSAVAVAAVVTGIARAQEASLLPTFGPEFGSNTISAEISSLTARPDVDDYVALLSEGEAISVKVSAAKKIDLRVTVEVLDPSGIDRASDGKVRIKKNGAKVSVSGVPVDAAGRWTVRIAGIEGTEGAYTAKFKVASPPPLKFKKQPIGRGVPTLRTHVFGVVEGTLLDLTLKGSKKGAPVSVSDLRGPLGRVSGLFEETDEAFVVKKTTTKLKKHRLDAGTGTYELDISADGVGEYNLTAKLTPPAHVNGKLSIISTNDPHLDDSGAPVRSAAGQPVRITGRNFQPNPPARVFIGPNEATVVSIGPARNTIDVIVPAGEDGSTQDVVVVNSDGQSAFARDFLVYVPEAIVADVTISSGPVLQGNQVRREGGATLLVTGANFETSDTVALNGAAVGRSGASATSFTVTVPAGAAGAVTLDVTDEFGRVQTVPNVAHRVGFENSTIAVSPGGSFVDDLSAFDAAIGDLDRDGRVDDLVIVTYNSESRLYPNYVDDPYYLYGVSQPENPVGTRAEYTRAFSTDNTGRLVDDTGDFIPAAGSDATGVEDWNALAVALGDLDGADGTDIVLAGSRGRYDPAREFPTVRVLTNNGSGRFRFDPALSPRALAAEAVVAVDETYTPPPPPVEGQDPPDPVGIHNVRSKRVAPKIAVALAIGDLDGDNAPDVVSGLPGFGYSYVFIDESYVDFSKTPPYIASSDVVDINEGRYFSGTRIFANRIGSGGSLADVTEARMPGVGIVGAPGLPAFPARDLALGDLDGDSDLDLIVTYNNPAAVIPSSAANSYGAYARYSYGRYEYSYDSATAIRTVATRVLENDGFGNFTDVTSTWLPAAFGDEFWQAHRIAFSDLDGDGDRDLVLLHRRALNDHRFNPGDTKTPPGRGSLRVLRNDGPTVGFIDVTATALPAELATFSGVAIAIADIDLDGLPELLVGTPVSKKDAQNVPLPSTRILWGGAGLRFSLKDDFVLGTDVDTGEATHILVGDLDRDGLPAIFLFGELPPQTSTNGELLRIFEWQR